MINKDKLHEFVEVFYQNPFKTFYVNSVNGNSFSKPTGVFVSLGITTSLKVLENLRKLINESFDDGNCKAEIAELKTTKCSGQFMNSISKSKEVVQYFIEELPKDCYNREEALEYFPTSPYKDKWESLFNKIETSEDGWKSCYIQITDGNLRIFHREINYKKDDSDESEYRVGIYVTEN